jgi:hypothetical protein
MYLSCLRCGRVRAHVRVCWVRSGSERSNHVPWVPTAFAHARGLPHPNNFPTVLRLADHHAYNAATSTWISRSAHCLIFFPLYFSYHAILRVSLLSYPLACVSFTQDSLPSYHIINFLACTTTLDDLLRPYILLDDTYSYHSRFWGVPQTFPLCAWTDMKNFLYFRS